MQSFDAKYAAFAVRDDRQSQRSTSWTCAVPWVIACLLVAIPLPAQCLIIFPSRMPMVLMRMSHISTPGRTALFCRRSAIMNGFPYATE
jgi:hypothetical protein